MQDPLIKERMLANYILPPVVFLRALPRSPAIFLHQCRLID
jgi:hypothetical protein